MINTVSNTPGTTVFDVSLDVSQVPDLSSYNVSLLLSFPGVSFNNAATSPDFQNSQATTTGGGVMNVNANPIATSYIFADNSFFTSTLNVDPFDSSQLQLLLTDFGGTLSGNNLIAEITLQYTGIGGTLNASINSDPSILLLQDPNGSLVQNYSPIQEQVATAPPTSYALSAVPEPAMAVLALSGIGLGLAAYRAHRMMRKTQAREHARSHADEAA